MTPEEEAQNPQTPPERLTELTSQSDALRRLVAKNPGVPLPLLTGLARHPDKLTLAGLAENPSTPLAALFQVGALFPLQFIKNPVVQLLLLEDPLFLRDAPLGLMIALLDVKDPPRWVLESALLHNTSTVRVALARCKGLPGAYLKRLLFHEEASARAALAGRKHLASQFLSALATDQEAAVRAAVAANPGTPADLLEDLSAEDNDQIRQALAKNPSTPPSVLKEFATQEGLPLHQLYPLQMALAQNPGAPPSVLKLLHERAQWRQVTIAISKNPNTPAHLKKLPPGLRRILRRGEWH